MRRKTAVSSRSSSVTASLLHDQTGTIGFWANKNGQALINLLGSTSTSLGNWLASTYPNIYGSSAGSHNLSGKSRSTVASLFITLFNVSGQKLDAQVLATALAVYTTTNTLNSTFAGQSFAQQHGFVISAPGSSSNLINMPWNIGLNGPAFGVANNTSLTIGQILLAANKYAVKGVLWANSIKINNVTYTSTTLRNMANTVFSAINQAGDISI